MVEAPTPPSPHAELRRFFKVLEQELDHVLERHPKWFGAYLDQFVAAWSEVKPYFGDARDALDQKKVSEDDLRRQGLTGSQLALKMAMFDGARNRFHKADSPNSASAGIRGRIRRRFPRVTSFFEGLSGRIPGIAGPAHWFGAFLDIANNILKSILGVLPIAEPISEFKDAVKAAVSAV